MNTVFVFGESSTDVFDTAFITHRHCRILIFIVLYTMYHLFAVCQKINNTATATATANFLVAQLHDWFTANKLSISID